MSRGTRLLELQKVENELRKRITTYKKVQKQLSGSSAVQEAREAYETAGSAEKGARRRQQQSNLELAELVEKIKSQEEELYSGRVKSPKELRNLELEIESLNKRRESVEEGTLFLIEEVESLSQSSVKAKKKYKQTQKATHKRQQILEKQAQVLKRHISKGRHVRQKILPTIDASDLELYRHVQRKKNDPSAVAELKNGVCNACNIEVSSGRRDLIEDRNKDNLLICGNCGRILIAS